MTTYRAIGKYEVGASDADKERALREAVESACVELATLGLSLVQIEQVCENALFAAEDEIDAMKEGDDE